MIESKVEMKEEVEKDEYPKLMISDAGVIVAFSEPGKGVIVGLKTETANKRVGYYKDYWGMEYFKPFHGTITLSNK